jgi:4-oxalocrotonate tautomerase
LAGKGRLWCPILSTGTAPAGALSESRFHYLESAMPTIRVELMEGRTPEQKKNLVSALTRAVVETLGTKPEAVDVLLFDIKRGDWATGGQLWSERK